jgi:hypothetical protein
MAPGSSLPLTEMSTRNLTAGKGKPAHKVDNLAAICEPIVWNTWKPPWSLAFEVALNSFARKKKTLWSEFASELYRPRDRCLSAKLVLTFEGRGCHVVILTDPYGRNLGFLDRSRYIVIQVAPQLYSRGWVDPVTDPLLLRKSGSAGIRTRTCGPVARNSDH